jgi:hypothetical protein
MADPITSSDFLGRALSLAAGADDISELLRQRVAEDLFLDFKSGLWLTRVAKHDPARALRSYVAGFANADGGAVVIGVKEIQEGACKSYEVDGCPPQGRQAWKDWAADSLAQIAGYLTRPPRMAEINHPGGTVLVVAIQRSNTFVPCPEGRRPVFYLRIGHQTLAIDPYLYADLMLGRRQTPHFTGEVECTATHDAQGGISLAVNITLTNSSMVWVPAFQVGVLGYHMPTNGLPRMTSPEWSGSPKGTAELPAVIHEHVKIVPSTLNYVCDPHLTRSRGDHLTQYSLGPLSSTQFEVSYRISSKPLYQVWRAAAYIAPANGLPEWFAIEVELIKGEARVATITKATEDLVTIAWVVK